MRRITYESFFDGLLEVVPEYRSMYDENLRFFKQLLPHVFLGLFRQFLDDALSRTDVGDLLERTLAYLEAAMHSDDPRVVELVGVSFVENLPGSVYFKELVEAMPPALRAEVRAQHLEP